MRRNAPACAPAVALALAAAVFFTAPVSADEVHLVNGETFEGVIATVEKSSVTVRLPHGVIRLPASRVLRVERSTSPLERFLRRSEELAGTRNAEAWLELALWAEEEGLSSGVRDAALRAARLDPRLPGLDPLMRGLGYGFDDEAGVWVPMDELMSRRGFVRLAGEWVPAEVAADAALRMAEEREQREAEAREARLDRVITLLAMAQLQEIEEERREPEVVVPYASPLAFGAPVASFHGGLFVGGHNRPGHRGPVRRRPPHPGDHGHRHTPGKVHHQRFTWDALAGRQPGSIIPIAVDPGAARGQH